MRLLLGLVFLSACGVHKERSVTSSGAESTLAVVAIPTRPWGEQRPVPPRAPIGVNTQVEVTASDSLSTALARARFSPSPDGDSVDEIGGAIIAAPYAVHEYQMRGVRYAAIEQVIGKKPDGQPLFGEVTRVTLPTMDSAEHLMFAGLCGTDYSSDPYVLAIVGPGEDTVNRVYHNIRKAWRFERASRSFRDIPTKGVVCFDPGED